jgi:hypothetical protein
MSGGSTKTKEEVDAENAKTRADALTEAGLNESEPTSSASSSNIASDVSPATASGSTVGAKAAPKGKGKAPVKRKPRQSLESMSAALDKGKKMTTLEKVSLDLPSLFLMSAVARHKNTRQTSADDSLQRTGNHILPPTPLCRLSSKQTGAEEDTWKNRVSWIESESGRAKRSKRRNGEARLDSCHSLMCSIYCTLEILYASRVTWQLRQ